MALQAAELRLMGLLYMSEMAACDLVEVKIGNFIPRK